MTKLMGALFALWQLWNFWLVIKFLLFLIGTCSDYARYSGQIDWQGTWAYFGGLVLQAVIPGLCVPVVLGLLAKGAK